MALVIIHGIHDWLQYGQDKGWASETFCEAHDGPPSTEEEAKELRELDPLDVEAESELLDRCMPAIRLFPPD